MTNLLQFDDQPAPTVEGQVLGLWGLPALGCTLRASWPQALSVEYSNTTQNQNQFQPQLLPVSGWIRPQPLQAAPLRQKAWKLSCLARVCTVCSEFVLFVLFEFVLVVGQSLYCWRFPGPGQQLLPVVPT
jgi:hypothetical protein